MTALLSGEQRARADEGSCAAVQKTKALAARRGLDLGDINRLERLECSDDAPGGGSQSWRGRGGAGLDEESFRQTVLRAVRSASRSEEPRTCRFYARTTRLTTAQLIEVIRAVGTSSEAACALAFFPGILDPINWEKVYVPMCSSAEQMVRETLDQ
jgi:predicted Zn-dependent protease